MAPFFPYVRTPMVLQNRGPYSSPVRYVTEYSFVQNFWKFGKLYIFGNLRTY